MIVRANATIETEYGTVPSDFLEVKSLKLQTNPITPLQFETIDSLDNLQQQYPSSSKPRFFSIVGAQIRTVPVPDSSYTAELTYYAKLTKLSSTVTVNWLLTAAPDVYLYGALLQAAPYLKDDARISVWATMYTSAMEDLQVADDRGATSGGALVARAKTFG
jgi:hypothetical protein